MAVRLDAAADTLALTAGVLNYNAAYTICGWAYPVASTGANMALFHVAADGNNLDRIRTNSTATSWSVQAIIGGTSTNTTGGSVSLTTWKHFAMVRADASTLRLYEDGALTATASAATGARSAATDLNIGNNHNSTIYFNGRVYAVKIWTAALSADELALEMRSVRPVRLSNLFAWYPLRPGSGERAKDYSGNGRNLTEGGTLADEDPPPISWGARAGFRPRSGGVQYSQSLAGTLTSSGAILKRAGKSLAGTLSSAGALARSTNKPLAGTLTSSGALARRTSKGIAGTLSSSGALSVARIFLKALAGTLTSSGALVRQTGKILSGTLSSSGAVLKQTAKNVVGTLTPGGTLAAVRTFLKAISGTLTSSGALVRRTGKTVAGTLTSNGALARLTGKSLAGTLTSSGTLVKRTAKWLVGTLTSSGTLVNNRLVAWLRHIFRVVADDHATTARLASQFSVPEEDASSVARLGSQFTVAADDRTSEV